MNIRAKMSWLTARVPVAKPAKAAASSAPVLPTQPASPTAAPAPQAPTNPTTPPHLSHVPPAARPRALPVLSGGALGLFRCPGLNATIAAETCASTRAGGKLKACDDCGSWPGAPKPAPAPPPKAKTTVRAKAPAKPKGKR